MVLADDAGILSVAVVIIQAAAAAAAGGGGSHSTGDDDGDDDDDDDDAAAAAVDAYGDGHHLPSLTTRKMRKKTRNYRAWEGRRCYPPLLPLRLLR